LIWLITLISTYFFVAKTWWLPVGASAATHWIDGQFALTFVIMGIVFLAAQLGSGYIVWKYRDGPRPLRFSILTETIRLRLPGRCSPRFCSSG
jgi:heme/copper-type cytochrome/quinol oxidase subunit 2